MTYDIAKYRDDFNKRTYHPTAFSDLPPDETKTPLGRLLATIPAAKDATAKFDILYNTQMYSYSPFVEFSMEGCSGGGGAVDSIHDIAPAYLRAGSVLHLPWQRGVLRMLQLCSPTFGVWRDGSPIMRPSYEMLAHAFARLGETAATWLSGRCLFHSANDPRCDLAKPGAAGSLHFGEGRPFTVDETRARMRELMSKLLGEDSRVSFGMLLQRTVFVAQMFILTLEPSIPYQQRYEPIFLLPDAIVLRQAMTNVDAATLFIADGDVTVFQWKNIVPHLYDTVVRTQRADEIFFSPLRVRRLEGQCFHNPAQAAPVGLPSPRVSAHAFAVDHVPGSVCREVETRVGLPDASEIPDEPADSGASSSSAGAAAAAAAADTTPPPRTGAAAAAAAPPSVKEQRRSAARARAQSLFVDDTADASDTDGEEGGADDTRSNISQLLPDSDTDEEDGDDTSDDDLGVDAVLAMKINAMYESLPERHNTRGISHCSAMGHLHVDKWLDESVDMGRLADVLRWRALKAADAGILVAFQKSDGRRVINYKPSKDPIITVVVSDDDSDGIEDVAPPTKRAKQKREQAKKKEARAAQKKRKQPPPRGLWHLSPGVRQFVLPPGTVCVDIISLREDVRRSLVKRPPHPERPQPFSLVDEQELFQLALDAAAEFYDRGADSGLLRNGVQLMSVVPEGLLIRGFLERQDVEDTFVACRAFIRRATPFARIKVTTMAVVDLTPRPGTEHPLAGDFRLWDEVDLSAFDTPAFRAMRNVIEAPAHPRAFDWFYDTEGNLGKTVHARYYAHRGACCVGAQAAGNVFFAIREHLRSHGTLRLLIVDLPRDMTGVNEAFANIVESIKDGLIFSHKYESGTIKMPSPIIVIMANAPPPDSFKYALSADRWRAVDLRNTPVQHGRFVLDPHAFSGVIDDDRYIALSPGPPMLTAAGGKLTGVQLPIVMEESEDEEASAAADALVDFLSQ